MGKIKISKNCLFTICIFNEDSRFSLKILFVCTMVILRFFHFHHTTNQQHSMF